MSLGLKIKQLREDNNLSQQDLAEKTSISKRMIGAYEKEADNIPLSKLRNIATVLGVSLASLIAEDSSQNENSGKALKLNSLGNPIPLVNVTAVGGFGNDSFSITDADIKEYYVIPKFKYSKIDFMIEVRGVSMAPRYNGGDIVACQIVKNSAFIQWNKIHVIATREQGIILKRIKSSKRKGYITVVADNPDYPPFEIPLNEITGLALVEGGVTIE